MNISNLIILVLLLLFIVLLVMKLNVKYTHIIEIVLIPIILYILLVRSNIVTNSETFIIICIGTIAAHLVFHIILKYYGVFIFHSDSSVSGNIEELVSF